MNINNYDDISIIRECLSLEEIYNNINSTHLIEAILFDFLWCDIYLISDMNDKIMIEIDLHDKGSFYLEWIYDVKVFTDFSYRLEDKEFETIDEELIVFKEFLNYVSSKRIYDKQSIAKEYDLK